MILCRKKRDLVILKKLAIQALKISIAVGLVGYLIYSGRLDLHAIYRAKSEHFNIFMVLFCLLCACAINFYRWNLLLLGQKIKLRKRDVISLSFIGLFFTTVLPGAVGGDLIKGIYIAKETPHKKTAAILTVLLDRVIGLVALIVICCIGLLLNFSVFMQIPALKSLGIVMYLILLGFMIMFAVGLSRRIYHHKITRFIFSKIPFSHAIQKLYFAFHSYRNESKKLSHSLLVSFVTHAFNIMAFYYATQALHFDKLDFHAYFFIVPLGMITTAIPIAPAGIGVGQAAFLKLFEWALNETTTVGADAITIVQAVSICIFMVGGFFYIGYRKKLKKTRR